MGYDTPTFAYLLNVHNIIILCIFIIKGIRLSKEKVEYGEIKRSKKSGKKWDEKFLNDKNHANQMDTRNTSSVNKSS